MEMVTRAADHAVIPPKKTPYMEHGEYLFETGMFSDCTIYCHGKSWRLHRAMLVPRCQFFRACFTSGFQESIAQTHSSEGPLMPTNSVAVAMHDDEPEALGRMLRWIYTFSYPAMTHSRDDAQNKLPEEFWTCELDLCIVSDKYNMISLLDDAAYSILNTAQMSISDPGSPQHCETFTSHLDDFVTMLEVLFTDAPLSNLSCDLQTELLEITGDMIAKYIGHEEKLSELLATVPAFGIMLVRVLGGSSSDSDTSDGSHEITPHLSTATRLISTQRHQSKRRQRKSSSGSESSSSSSPDLVILGRDQLSTRESTKARGRRQQTAVVQKVHIPMNEDSDLD